MRHLARVLVCMTLFAGTWQATCRADGWWPFGAKDDAEPTPPPAHVEHLSSDAATITQRTAPLGKMSSPPSRSALGTIKPYSSATSASPTAKTTTALRPTQSPNTAVAADETPWYAKSPFSSAHGPKSPLAAGKEKAEANRNAWVEKRPEPAGFSPVQAMSNGAHRVTEGTKAAWRKTVDVLTPGDSSKKPPTRVAKRDTEPSLWSRMVPGTESKQEGPRTVTEWMGQERLKP